MRRGDREDEYDRGAAAVIEHADPQRRRPGPRDEAEETSLLEDAAGCPVHGDRGRAGGIAAAADPFAEARCGRRKFHPARVASFSRSTPMWQRHAT